MERAPQTNRMQQTRRPDPADALEPSPRARQQQEAPKHSEEAKTNPDIAFGDLSIATQTKCLPQILEQLAACTSLPKSLHHLVTSYAVWDHSLLRVGSVIDCRDFLNDWYNASVIQVKGTSVLIHYIGWSRKWDEWLDRRSDTDLERMAPAFHRTVRWGLDIKVGDIVHIKTPYRDSREARVLQIMNGQEVCNRRLKAAERLYRGGMAPGPLTRRASLPTQTLNPCSASGGSAHQRRSSMVQFDDQNVDNLNILDRFVNSQLNAVTGGEGPGLNSVHLMSNNHLVRPTPPLAHGASLHHRSASMPAFSLSMALSAPMIEDDPDPKESVEFLRTCVQQCGDSMKGMTRVHTPGLDSTTESSPGPLRQLDDLIKQEQSAIPLWMPLCEAACSCYESSERASSLCLQNLTGHKHVHRWCAGSEIAIWKSSTTPDDVLQREAREREAREMQQQAQGRPA